ncbi:hypothetical protein IFM89_024710 [Coptis chinensis]|uniref:Uncharacterized protein n=1 Tax=Coptis chinensis TaxID=261450 RepID=A0A835IEE2_9MAGN|nr:hypothetical protein IFM89_024710 [Coptis chinensis]
MCAACPSGSFIYLLLMPVLCSQLFMGSKYRRKLRKKYNLVEAPFGDCFSHLFCPCCSLCQEFRELQSRGDDPNLGIFFSFPLLSSPIGLFLGGRDCLPNELCNRDIQIKSCILLRIKPCPSKFWFCCHFNLSLFDESTESVNEIDETDRNPPRAQTIHNYNEEPRTEIVHNQIGEPWKTGLFDCNQNQTNGWNGLLALQAMQQRYPDQVQLPPKHQTMSK